VAGKIIGADGRPTPAHLGARKALRRAVAEAREAAAGRRRDPRSTFAIVLNDVIESAAFLGLGRNAGLVYLRLCGFWNHETGRCDPQRETLADRLHLQPDEARV